MSAKIVCALYFTGLFLAFVPDTQGKTCWDQTWFNSTSPNDHGGSDIETLTASILNGICPGNKPVTAARCKDEKGEPFSGFKNDTGNHYIATCNVVTGLQCHPYNNTVGASCADFAIQYGCECTTTTSPTTTGAFVNTPRQTILPGSGSGGGVTGGVSGGGSSGSGSGGGVTGGASGGGSSGGGSGGGVTGGVPGVGSNGSGSGGTGSGESGSGESGSGGSGSGGGVTGGVSGGRSSGSGSGGGGSGGGVTGEVPGVGSNGSGSGGTGSGGSGSGGSGSGGSGSGGGVAGGVSGGGSNGSGSGGSGNGSEGGSNLSGGNSALGGSCPCRNGSQKTDFTLIPIFVCVLLKLYIL